MRPPVVVKFGGGALSDLPRVLKHVRRARSSPSPLVVVVSARRGVTDLLLKAIDSGGEVRPEMVESGLRELHPRLSTSEPELFVRVRTLLTRLSVARSPLRPVRDELLSQGERLAAHWLAGELAEAGIPSIAVESDHLGLTTDESYGASLIQISRSTPQVRPGLERLLAEGLVPVVTGYFGRSDAGHVTTLGRGGSDYTAVALGRILSAQRVELVKRNVAVLTADPRWVPAATRIPRLSYDEAEELAQFGASVLHPAAIAPAREGNIDLTVRSLIDPHISTRIGPSSARPTFRCVTALGPLAMVGVRLPGARLRGGILAAVAQALSDAAINAQALVTTEAVIGILVDPSDSDRTEAVLAPLAQRLGGRVRPSPPVQLLSVLGPRVLERVARIPRWILRESFGLLATSRAISVAIPEGDAPRAMRALHREFVDVGAPSRTRRARS
ncbi:MAG TPA: aspartate kinase [Thermoplasmata archaeon]|nr:aspartate kinase [Thermoplasmata archaeon]